MQDNLLEEAKKHFNEPILIGFDLCRCIGYAEDDDDCYLIVKRPNGPRAGVSWCTFVGGYTYLDCLKQQGVTQSLHTNEIWTDYSRLDNTLELNGCEKEEKFIVIQKTTTFIEVNNE